MTVGERIKERRKALEISADTLADILHISRSTMFRYENGDIEKFPTSSLEPIARALRTTPKYLMGWTDNPDEGFISDSFYFNSTSPALVLTDEETELVADFRDASDDVRRSAKMILAASAEAERKKNAEELSSRSAV